MNGADSLVQTLCANGVNVCFANPGTSEMHFVAALDREPGMRCVLSLFEGVATGAADGYYRMTGKPAATLLHLGSGLSNGSANLHNAKKARSGIVNIVGDHATHHLRRESPLKSDVEALARPLSRWVRSSRSSMDVAADGASAIAATRDGLAGDIATLILPADTAWGPGGEAVRASSANGAAELDKSVIQETARRLSEEASASVLLLGGNGTYEQSLVLASAISAKTGCRVFTQFYSARSQGGRTRPYIERMPFSVDAAVSKLQGASLLVLAGADDPVAFFAYPGKPSRLAPPGAAVQCLARREDDVQALLQALADELGVRADPPPPRSPLRADLNDGSHGALTPDAIALALAATLPDHAIVVDEAISSGRAFGATLAHAAPHDMLSLMGGAIGFGLPAAVGAALGAPGRRVVALEGDGSAMYTLQALWTMAREALPVVTIIFSNRSYRILQSELQGVGAEIHGPKARDMLSLDNPPLDWVALAKGLGVPAASANDASSFAHTLRCAFASEGPYLIEAVI